MRFENEHGWGMRSAMPESVGPYPLRSLPSSHFLLGLSLSLIFCIHPSAPLAWAPRLSPSSNPLRHALACVNHAYRFSFVRVSEGRSVVAHVWPLLPFSPRSLSRCRSPPPFFLTENPGATPYERAPFWKCIRARGTWFFSYNGPHFRFLSVPLPPRSLSLLLFYYPRPFLRVPLFVTSRKRSPRRLLFPRSPDNLHSINSPSSSSAPSDTTLRPQQNIQGFWNLEIQIVRIECFDSNPYIIALNFCDTLLCFQTFLGKNNGTIKFS